MDTESSKVRMLDNEHAESVQRWKTDLIDRKQVLSIFSMESGWQIGFQNGITLTYFLILRLSL